MSGLFRGLFVAIVLILAADHGYGAMQVRRVAFWPLDEGEGRIVRDRVGNSHGRFYDRNMAAKLRWDVEGDKKVLVFPDPGSERKNDRYVEIPHGGAILKGAFFAVGVDIYLEKTDEGRLYLLACKHCTTKTGGFLLDYWAKARKLSFSFSDGKEIFSFTANMKKELPLKKWVPISVVADGGTLTIRVDDKVVGSWEQAGRILAQSRYPLIVGGYYSGFAGSPFCGKVRNLWLGIPEAGANKAMFYHVKAIDAAPAIDGKLDDACWQEAGFVGDFMKFYQGRPATTQTEFAAASDGQNLYLGVRCLQPRMEKIHFQKRDRDGWVFDDESFEVFIDPDCSGDHYFQLALNAANSQFDAVITDFGNMVREDFDMKWDSAVQKDSRQWTAEIAIPFQELLVRPDNPGYWHFNVCRNDSAAEGKQERYSTWGRLREGEKNPGFHNFRLFGILGNLPKPRYSSDVATQVARGRKAWRLDEKPIPSEIALFPIHEPLMVANNLVVPNVLGNKAPGSTVTRLNARYFLDLPDDIALLHIGNAKYNTAGAGPGEFIYEKEKVVIHDGRQYTRYIVRPVRIHPSRRLFSAIYMKSSLPDGSRTDILCGAKWDGGEQEPRKVPVVVKTFPTPGKPEKLVSSLAWMFADVYLAWPDMLDTYQKLGFNTISTHVTWDRTIPDEKRVKFLDEARQQGLKIMCVDSPFQGIRARAEGHSTDANGAPIPCGDACPAYRGEIYQQDLKRIADAAVLIRPDIVNLDIECYASGASRGLTGGCKRCGDYIAKSGKAPEEAMTDLGTEIMMDVRKALTRAMKPMGLPAPKLGTYHTKPGGFVYQGIFDYDKMARAGAVDYCHPVFYRSGKAKATGEEIRRLRKQMRKGEMIPWMTTGYTDAGGNNVEYPSEWVYDYVLEAYGSGVKGIYWFAFSKFESSDYYYHAKAMESINPVAEIIYDGEPLEGVTSDTPSIEVSAIRGENQDVVLLMSDYESKSPAAVTVSFPIVLKGKVWRLAEREICGEADGKNLTVQFRPGVEGAHCALYYIGAEPLE